MSKPPKIVIPGLNRGAGVPPGYILGRLPGTGHGPAQLLNLNQLRRVGLATAAGVVQSTSSTVSTVNSLVVSQSTAISTVISGSISSVNSRVDSLSVAVGGGGGGGTSTSLSQISSSLSGVISTNVLQSTSLSQISSSLSGAISSTTSLSTAVSTVDSGQTVSLSQISSSLSGAISSTSSLSAAVSTVDSNQSTSISINLSKINSLSTAIGSGGAIAVQDEGALVVTASTLNFTGAGIAATDAGGGVADIDVGIWAPVVDGSSPPVFILDGSNQLVMTRIA